MVDPRVDRSGANPGTGTTAPPYPPARGSITEARARGGAAPQAPDRPSDGVSPSGQGPTGRGSLDPEALKNAWGATAREPDAQTLAQVKSRLDQVETLVRALEAGKSRMDPGQLHAMAGQALSMLGAAERTLSGAPPPTGASKADYEARVPFLRFGAQKPVGGNGLLWDVERHLPARYGGTYRDSDPVTWAHETTHGINSHLRNTPALNRTGREVNGFYVGGDRAIVLPEPPIRKSSVAGYVPQSLRGGRFGMYVTGQQAFEGQPLYLMDEWTAYTNGGAVGVELAKSGQWRQGGRDAVAGIVEFTGYGFGLARAIEAQHPGYLDRNPDLKDFIAWQGLHAMDTFREGMNLPSFRNFPQQHQLYRNLQSHPDAEPLRAFIRRTWGEEYLQRLLQGGS